MLELAICDDEIILCNWLEQKLLNYGKANDCQISVEIYYSAKQLLNRLEEESYDMLFLDICLEHENGIDYVMGFQSCSFNGMRLQEIRCIITWDRELS